ncbi:MAG TPA: hypothetical protein VE487_15400 [Ilumatobacter sp.]|nr:hypothetical protein [Ilumatobacter sp.]
MHRSGTSLLAGVVDALGFHGGPRATMLTPDQFNRDGYWEQRPIVELHDEVLLRLGGFASAPPTDTTLEPNLAREVGPRIERTIADFERPWFVKDPRQVLLLDAWDAALGDRAFAVIASRCPQDVIRSLRHRNGYSVQLAGGLWEHYTRALLSSARGRRCYVVQYDDLLNRRGDVITDLAVVLSNEVSLDGPIQQSAIDAAIALVRSPSAASSSSSTPATGDVEPEQDALYDLVRELRGHHAALDVPQLPRASDAGRRAIERRRRRLRTARYIVGRRATLRASLDRRWR